MNKPEPDALILKIPPKVVKAAVLKHLIGAGIVSPKEAHRIEIRIFRGTGKDIGAMAIWCDEKEFVG